MNFQFIAHRGASHDAPENTLAAIQLAWEQGADAVEIDCQITSDGHAVVFHDPDTRRSTAVDKVVSQTSLDDLRRLDVGASHGPEWAGQRIPTLAEVIDIVPPGKRLFIEVKSSNEITPRLTKTLREAARGTAELAAELVVTSFDVGVLHGVKQQLPHTTCYLVGRFVPEPELAVWVPTVQDLLRTARLAAANGLNVSDHPIVDRPFCDQVAAAGLELYVWTVDDPQRTAQLIDAGAAGVFTNRPGWLRQEVASLCSSPDN